MYKCVNTKRMKKKDKKCPSVTQNEIFEICELYKECYIFIFILKKNIICYTEKNQEIRIHHLLPILTFQIKISKNHATNHIFSRVSLQHQIFQNVAQINWATNYFSKI